MAVESGFVIVAVLFVFGFSWADYQTADGGRVAGLNADLGYFALLAKEVPGAGVASTWAAALGSMTLAAGETQDVWYHWGPVWLVYGISEMTGFPELAVLLKVVAPALSAVLLLLAGSMVGNLTGWALGRSLLAGGASLVALTLPTMGLAAWLGQWLPSGGVLQHFHPSLAYQFSYKFEAVLVLGALSSWLMKRRLLAALLLFTAGVCAPHTVAGGGLTAGMLAAIGVVMRERQVVRFAVGTLITLLLAWLSVRFLFHVGMPKSDGAALVNLQPDVVLRNLGLGLRDVLIGAALALLALPGILHLIRHSGDGRQEPRLLGLVAVAALAGSYLAFHLLLPDGDRSHFTMYAHALIVMPVGFWGLLRLFEIHSGWLRRAAFAALLLMVSAGAFEWWQLRAWQTPLALAVEDVAKVKEKLGGHPWGYFAEADRNWWISQHAILAGLLDARGVRLNAIARIDADSHAARFYGSSRPYDLVPRHPDEPEEQWSRRFAQRLGLRFVLHIGESPVPAEIAAMMREVFSVPGIRVFEFKPKAAWSGAPETANPTRRPHDDV